MKTADVKTWGNVLEFLDNLASKEEISNATWKTYSKWYRAILKIHKEKITGSEENITEKWKNALIGHGLSQEWSPKTYRLAWTGVMTVLASDSVETLKKLDPDQLRIETSQNTLLEPAIGYLLPILLDQPPTEYNRQAKMAGKSKNSKSKKESFQGLDPNWPFVFCMAIPERYRHFAIVQLLTASRPADFGPKQDNRPEGFEIRKIGPTQSEISIYPSKYDGKEKSHKWKKMIYDWSQADLWIKALWKELERLCLLEGKTEVSLKLPSTVEAYQASLRRVGRKLWPRRKNKISAYSLRHWAATNLRKIAAAEEGGESGRRHETSQATRLSIAKLLGHQSTRTQSSYGRVGVGRGGVSMGEINVEVSGDIRDVQGLRNAKMEKRLGLGSEPDFGSNSGPGM